MKMFFIMILNMMVISSWAQSPSDTINPSTINLKLIETLTIQNINKERIAHHVKALTQNNFLNLAALDQAKYIKSTQKLTHKQIVSNKATVTLRVKFYGGNFTFLGENVAFTPILKPMKVYGTNNIVTLHTYQQTADFFVVAWMASTLHRKNILDPNFELSGLRMDFDSKTKRIYAAQVFGKL